MRQYMGRAWTVVFWFTCIIAVGVLISTSIKAFSVPWRWTQDQIAAVILWTIYGSAAFKWAIIWRRDGYSGVREKWKALSRETTAVLAKPMLTWSVLFWVVIAMLLVFYFNWQQQLGVR
jgi:hypothetical protein